MRTVLITGGAVRLGKSLALNFAKNGFRVAFSYYRSESEAEKTREEINKFQPSSIAIKADLRDSVQIKKMFERTFAEMGKIDVLINNAGYFPKPSSLQELEEEIWDETFNINLKAAFLCSKEFSKQEGDDLRIVNIASVGALKHWKGRITYNTSKSALVHLTKSLALDLAPKIAVNSISPGMIDFGSEEDFKLELENIPMKAFATPEEIFSAVQFFVNCTKNITGQNLCVDGGLSLK